MTRGLLTIILFGALTASAAPWARVPGLQVKRATAAVASLTTNVFETLMTFETGSAGDLMTETLWTNSCIGYNGPFTIMSAAPHERLYITNVNFTTSDFNVNVAGASRDGSGTRALVVRAAVATTPDTVYLDLPGDVNQFSNVTMSAFMMFGLHSSDFDLYYCDHFVIEAENNQYGVMQQQVSSAANNNLFGHSDSNGVTMRSVAMPILTNTWYYVELMRSELSSNNTVTIRGPQTNGAAFNTNIISQQVCGHGANSSGYAIRIGDNIGGALTRVNWTIMDNILLKWTNNNNFIGVPIAQ